MLALDVRDRDEILTVLVDCPEGLCELRAVLLKQECGKGSARSLDAEGSEE